MQYTIGKPYKIVTKNEKKKIEIFNFCYHFRAIFEKVVFFNFEISECFRMKLSAKLPH